MSSLWTQNIEMPEFPELRKDIRTQVLVIGGGMAGILCAYFLEQAGVDYCLLEKEKICKKSTAHMTGMVTVAQGLIYEKVLQKLGQERAGLFLEANQKALQNCRSLGSVLDCDMEEKEMILYAVKDRRRLENEMQALSSLGYQTVYREQTELPFEVMGAVGFPGQLRLHPLKFAGGLAKNLRIYEHSEVKEMTEYLALTEKGSVAAEKIIITSGRPIVPWKGGYEIKLYPAEGYMTAAENAAHFEGMYQGTEQEDISFLNDKNLLLLAGELHRSKAGGPQWEELRSFLKTYFPEAKERYFWKNQTFVPLDERPYIGSYSQSTPDLFLAAGFRRWGMTGAMLSAMILKDLVLEKENSYASLFRPSRNPVKPQLFLNIGHLLKEKGKFDRENR